MSRSSAACRSTTDPPIDQPHVTTSAYPSSRACRTAASRSRISLSPRVDWPLEPPCPRKSNATTPACFDSASTTARTAGRSIEPVKPCATTTASGRSGSAGPGTCRAASRSPACVTRCTRLFWTPNLSWAASPAVRGSSGRYDDVATLLLLTNAPGSSAEVLPTLGLLGHTVRVLPLDAAALVDAPPAVRPAPPPDLVLLAPRRDLLAARSTSRVLRATGTSVPLIAVVTEGGLAAVAPDWGLDDVMVDQAGPAEVEARVRLALGRVTQSAAAASEQSEEIRSGDLSIDEATYQARVGGRALDLTFKEFELLKYLAQHPGRVFSRAQLLQEVWGYDYFGGTRTVDVHVRRLRAKLGPEREALIGTVRNVGYKFVAQAVDPLPEQAALSATKSP